MQKKTVKRKWKYKGISEDAAALGVTRVHLWKVLEGDRDSKPLMRRYRELKRQQKAAKLLSIAA